MSDTPRTDASTSRCGAISQAEHVSADFARQLERELNEARETISQCIERIRKEEAKASGCGRASIAAERHCKRISTDRDQWKAMAQELAVELEKACRRYRMMMAVKTEELRTLTTPHDAALSRFNELNK